MANRDIFGELMEGVVAMKGHRQGKLSLRTHKVDVAPFPKVESRHLRDTEKTALLKSGVRPQTADQRKSAEKMKTI